MEHTTFAKKTVVLAALGALSLMAATVRAADETETEPDPVKITVEIDGTDTTSIRSTIGDAVTWDDKWLDDVLGEKESFDGLTVVEGDNDANTITVTDGGSLTIDLPTQEATEAGNDGKVVTFDDVDLNVTKGGAFSNSSHVTFQNGSLTVTDGDFTNEEGGVIKFVGSSDSQQASFTLSVNNADAVKNFTNEGKIVLGSNAQMTVGSDSILAVETEDALALNVGNVEIGKGATLTNQDKGYQVTEEPKGKSDGEGAEPGEVQTLVHFGTVTVAVGGNFVNASGALSEGETLVLEAENTVEIDGTSVWNTLHLSNVEGEKTVNNYVGIVTNDDESVKGDFRVTGALVIDQFGADQDGKAGAFTIDGATNDSKVFADGVDISAGSHIATTALEQKNAGEGLTWKTDGKPTVGTLKLTGFAATFEEAVETPEEGAKAEEGEDEATTNGSWTYKKFGDVTVVNTNLKISGSKSSSEGSDPYDGHGYTPSLEMSSLNLVGTSMKIAYDVEDVMNFVS